FSDFIGCWRADFSSIVLLVDCEVCVEYWRQNDFVSGGNQVAKPDQPLPVRVNSSVELPYE
ncbi:MAG TPA: hypothetical protein PKI25_08525, partial [Nitrosomonas europaea]|nr:hypothetical protein [Nitrosomonas europaea]